MINQNEEACERAVLIGLDADIYTDAEAVNDSTMDELAELLSTAGGEAVARVIQHRQSPEPKTLIGTGKAHEIAEFIASSDVTLAVFDNELSPAQTKNLEDILGVRVIDRSTLILDIFASRAQSREGRLQVELAQYKYLLPRLSGSGTALSRLGGGIGTRGPGETKLETDRRHIRRRISRIEDELENVMRVRGEQRRARIKREVPLVALIGYTNAGKSTLLNALTGSDIHAADRLFDTLDPTARKFRISDTAEVVLSDTVGFIRKLPHHLTRAFRATLEELLYADLLLHVVDASNPEMGAHALVVEDVIKNLGAGDTPRLCVFNKCDLVSDVSPFSHDADSVCVSAVTGDGFDELKEKICHALSLTSRRTELEIPYSKSALLDTLHREAKVLSVEYGETAIKVTALVDDRVFGLINHELRGDMN
ncbi:MAG: GTPase HflX [Oscillospiraceae bacterium]|nr:GTPase HflX [Oscillospiraceae bacterium]MBQ6902785.1 GTPase HflX [Oscillospiraceae bacterium]